MSGQYHRPHSWAWFMERPAYILFMIRELTSVFVAGYLIVLVITLAKVGGGEAAGAEWLQALSGTGWRVAHALALVAALWHSITWFNLVPQAMPIYIGEERLPGPIAAVVMGYGPWLTVSAIIVWAVLR